MARVREFDPHETLEQAMLVFWEQGFSNTSVEDIVASTGVSRYGLYNTFGNKRDLFIAALQRYADHIANDLHPRLFSDGSSLSDIEDFAAGMLERATGVDGHKNCMICHTAIEVAPQDPAIAAAVRDLYDQLANAFTAALMHGQKTGDVSKKLDARAAGQMLVGVMQGAIVLARAGTSKTRLREYLNTALGTLA